MYERLNKYRHRADYYGFKLNKKSEKTCDSDAYHLAKISFDDDLITHEELMRVFNSNEVHKVMLAFKKFDKESILRALGIW